MTEATNKNGLRAEIRMVLATERVTQTQVAREIGISPSAFNQWLQAAYAGDNAAIEEKLGKWQDARRAQRSSAEIMPRAPEFFATPTAQKVIDALTYAQVAGDIVVVYGAAGLGKTTAIRRYRAMGLNVWHATMSPGATNLVAALQEIADAIGIPEMGGGAAALYSAILRRVRGTNGLLVLDEAQFLSVPALEQIRAIHDAVEIGIALVGNETVYDRMTIGRRKNDLDRLYSRVGKRVPLKGASAGDVAALINAWHVDDRGTRAELADLANKPGALRTVTKVLRLALMNALAAREPLDAKCVRHAWGELMGVEE